MDTSACAEYCNCSKFDAASKWAVSYRPTARLSEWLGKSAAARGFGVDDVVSNVLAVVADGGTPEFRSVSSRGGDWLKYAYAQPPEEDVAVAKRLAKKYVMYKLAALCDCISRNPDLNEDDVIFVAAAQDMKK